MRIVADDATSHVPMFTFTISLTLQTAGKGSQKEVNEYEIK